MMRKNPVSFVITLVILMTISAITVSCGSKSNNSAGNRSGVANAVKF